MVFEDRGLASDLVIKKVTAYGKYYFHAPETTGQLLTQCGCGHCHSESHLSLQEDALALRGNDHSAPLGNN